MEKTVDGNLLEVDVKAALEKYFDVGVKDVIEKFPAAGDVLNSYGIGCVTCYEGSCKLREVVEYHYLPTDKKEELWERLGAVLGGKEDAGARAESASAGVIVSPAQIKYSPPVKELVDEHTLIKRWLALIPAVLEKVDLEKDADRDFVRDGIDFIRGYADRFHHAKEEDVLFKLFDESQEIIQVMYENHTTGRNHVKAMVEAVDEKNVAKLSEHMLGYIELLKEHIRKEDEILYPWMDRQMSDSQIGVLFNSFGEVNRRFEDAAKKYEGFIISAEEKYK